MGLINRLCESGHALEKALELAQQLCQFPQRCMRSDRLSSYQQWHLSAHDALLNETRLGLQVIRSGETREGAARFSSGAGRHGSFDNI
jgi:enoyl-CoA hydratase